MKLTVACVALALAAVALPLEAQKEPDRWLAGDKVKHFMIAGFTYGMSHAGLQFVRASEGQQMWGAAGSAAVFSIGKEIFDRHRGSVFSLRDIVWDGAGVILTGVLLLHVRR